MILKGKVQPGLGIGKKLGYPTANLECDKSQYPAPGVYVARCMLDGVVHDAVVVVGARQERGKPLIEVHFFDFVGDLWGKELEVDVFEKVSEIQKFEDESKLLQKIKEDVKKARVCLRELSKPQDA